LKTILIVIKNITQTYDHKKALISPYDVII